MLLVDVRTPCPVVAVSTTRPAADVGPERSIWLTERERRARDDRSETPGSGVGARRDPARPDPTARQTDTRLPAPFEPRFGWRPDATDFPVPLSAPPAARTTPAP